MTLKVCQDPLNPRPGGAGPPQNPKLGAYAGIDVFSIIATDNDCNNWRLDPVYIHGQLTSPIVCDSIYHGQKLGIVYHRIHHYVGSEHFDPFYLVAQ